MHKRGLKLIIRNAENKKPEKFTGKPIRNYITVKTITIKAVIIEGDISFFPFSQVKDKP